ncbi:MAG: SusC/RagA family TonB-linked outer membrane protein [Muribaculaceae bacterium]|nr:SusC/RagA family TonB-linked outer membrane protein [Muribaculaceae bacterium]
MKRFTLLLANVLLICSAALAQVTITGTVVSASDNEPIIGATVNVVGTQTGTATDIDGRFTLTVPSTNSQLKVSFIGMTPITVKAENGMVIEMHSNTQDLDEVVVVAYGTAKKSALTGAVSQVTAQQIEARPVTSVTSALEGTTTGLVVNSTYGQPGSDASIRIRGFASINGSNEPLYVIDGVPFGGNISDLNSADIESITVLKDATSAALYGNRAGNGVILINTKRGHNDKVRINASAMMGTYTRGIPEYDRMNARQWMNAMMQSYAREHYAAGNSGDKTMSWDQAIANANAGIITDYLHYNIFDQPDNDLFNGIYLKNNAQIKSGIADDLDWFKAAIRSGFRQDYTLSGDGGNQMANYYFSAGYTKEDGYTKESGFERITGRASVNLNPKKWFKTGMTLAGSHQLTNFHSDNEDSYKNAFGYCRNIAPIYPIHLHDMTTGDYMVDENGNLIYDSGDVNGRTQYSGRHYLWETELDMDKTYRNVLNGQAYMTFVLPYGFDLTVKGDLNVRNTENREYNNAIIGDGQGNNARTKRTIYRYKNYTLQQLLNWKQTYGNRHAFEVLLGHENYYYKYNYLYGFKANETLAGHVDMINFSDIQNLYDYENNDRRESYLGRLIYGLDDKYIFEGTFRRDGSSRFHKDHRWGNFYSIGGTWVMSREDFINKYDWINNLKFRVAYGEVANDRAADYYSYMALYDITVNGGMGALVKSQLTNELLSWESVRNLSIGLEGRLFNRLNFGLDYFIKGSKDLIFNLNQPLSAGATSTSSAVSQVQVNLGNMVNRGIEFSADADIIQTKDLRFNLGLNLTFIKNKITKMPDIYNVGGEKDEYTAGLQSGQYNYRKGHSMYSFYTYTYKGIDDMTGKALYTFNDHDYYVPGMTTGSTEGLEAIPEGEYVVIDGVPYVYKPATYGKREWHGSAMPKLYGSFNPTIDYKNFTLSGIFSFQLGGKCIDWTYQSLTSMGGSPSAIHADMENAWIKDLNGTAVTYTDDQIKGMTVTDAEGNSYVNYPGSRLDPNGTPAVYSADNSYNSATSDRYITSSNYFIIKNIGLTYRLPRFILDKIGFTYISLNATVENLYTKSARKGMNPQQSFSGYVGDIMVTPRVFSFGVKIGF